MEYNQHCPHIIPGNEVLEYSADTNLFFLREDLADETGAITGYLECAALAQHPMIKEQFTRIAVEEAGHFIRLTRMISSLDPVQALQLKQQELTVLTLVQDSPAPPLAGTSCGDCRQSKANRPSSERKNYQGDRYSKCDFQEREYLGNAIRDELRAINAYQQQVRLTANQAIQNLLITVMNQEKEHLARFIRLFYDLQH